MVIYHTGSLHKSITNGGTEKFEPALFHVLADRVGYWRAYYGFAQGVINGFAIGHKAVQVFIE